MFSFIRSTHRVLQMTLSISELDLTKNLVLQVNNRQLAALTNKRWRHHRFKTPKAFTKMIRLNQLT